MSTDTTEETGETPDSDAKREMTEEMRRLSMSEDGSDDVELGMVIDLQRCTGCEACNIACKIENNLDEGHAWSSREQETEGEFPDVRHTYRPTLCNQCMDPPCASGCPTNSLYKGKGGVTMQDPDKCIGCKYCMVTCPYDEMEINEADPHGGWESDEAAVEDGTASPRELKEVLGVEGDAPATYNPNREAGEHEDPTRYKGIAEKCTFCIHRVEEGELPACVEECPSDARIFGDLNDPDSKIREVLGRYEPERLKEEKGTRPKVFYVRSFNGGGYEPGKGSVEGLDI